MDTINDTIREFHNKGLVLMPLIDNRPMLRNWQNLTIKGFESNFQVLNNLINTLNE